MTTESTPSRSQSNRVVVATTVLLSFISFWRAAAIVLARPGIDRVLRGRHRRAGHRTGRAVVRSRRDALLVGRPRDLHRELGDVRPRRRVSRRQGSHGRHHGQAVRVGAAVRLRPDGADQRRVGRPVHRGPGLARCSRSSASACRCREDQIAAVFAMGDHRVLLAAQHPGPARIEQRCAAHHPDHLGDGRHPARMVDRHAADPRRRTCRRPRPSRTSRSRTMRSGG